MTSSHEYLIEDFRLKRPVSEAEHQSDSVPRTMCFVFVLIVSLISVHSQKSDECNSKQTCGGCIQTNGCAWCLKPYPNTTAPHCIEEEQTTKCSPEHLYKPPQLYTVLEDKPFESSTDGTAVQLRPQRVRLSLRVGEAFVLPFQYRQAENYPVDLYYIMDLSASMDTHKKKLATLGESLAQAMVRLTSNFRIGFGSFVDKTDMPFISTSPTKLKNPCANSNIQCAPAYSFKNHMSLTKDFGMFSRQVSKASVSGNLDAPEGGFDAIMQAIVCKKEIGWRKDARHLIVLSTDADFHIAGDGKLAGVVEPNNFRCYVENGTYTHDLVYDYPSVSQLNYAAKENNVNLIFAITSKRAAYEKLQEVIENSEVGILSGDSSNVVNLVKENYKKISDYVVISDNAKTDVELTYNSSCSSRRTNGCNDIHVGEVVNFTATIRIIKCNPPQVIRIKPHGLDEVLTIELETNCNCPCENSAHPTYVKDSATCNGQGDLQCGICSCRSGRFGNNCECDSSTSYTDDTKACKKHENDTEICSGLGICRCGLCECTKRPFPQEIYGKYCECDNYSCDRSNRMVCSGAERGFCDCGKCKCLAGWTGPACQCPDNNATCVKPSDGKLCSGRGDCVCGECSCYEYSGQYCDECPSCPGQRCYDFRDCVECQAYKSGAIGEEECSKKCSSFATEVVDKLEDAGDDRVKICRVPEASGCTVVYQYELDDSGGIASVKAERKKICAEVDILALVLFIVGSVVMAGVVLLTVWKAFTTIHDRREYAKFENEKANARWNTGENPIYRKATSEFRNPLYNS